MTVEESRPTEARRRSVSSEISTGLVQLLRDYTGRGPTRARTYISDNLVTCVLQDTLTQGERVLAAHQGHELVLEHRKAFQNAMRSSAEALVERATGRRVIAFLSDNRIDPDVAVATFLLEELPGPGEGEPNDPGQG